MRQLEAGFDLIYPARCAGCGKGGAVWCEEWERQIHEIGSGIYDWCGQPLTARGGCSVCGTIELPMRARAFAHYGGPVARALLMLKYRPNRRLVELMGGWLTTLIQSQNWEISGVVPAPLGAERLRQRGYNQAALLGAALTKSLDVPMEDELLERHRETRSQVGLNAQARHDNVRGAFRAVRNLRPDERLFIVDDLFTTGSTLAACGNALLEDGCGEVYAVTVARATGRR